MVDEFVMSHTLDHPAAGDGAARVWEGDGDSSTYYGGRAYRPRALLVEEEGDDRDDGLGLMAATGSLGRLVCQGDPFCDGDGDSDDERAPV